MSFLSVNYMLFLLFVLGIYYFLNNKCQKYLILFSSFYFYSKFVTREIFLVIFYLALISYLFGIILNKEKDKKYLIIGIMSILCPLILSKYFLNLFNMNGLITIGLSFYTFEAISYIVDIYKEKIKFRDNFIDLLIYLLFFPTILQGPIIKSSFFLLNLKKKENTLMN